MTFRNPCALNYHVNRCLLRKKKAQAKRNYDDKTSIFSEQPACYKWKATLANLRKRIQKLKGKLGKSRIKIKRKLYGSHKDQKVALDQKENYVDSIVFSINPTRPMKTAFSKLFPYLISNAIKFSQTDGKFWINARKKPNRKINIAIIDPRFRGLKKKYQKALFKPFTEHSRLGTKGESSQEWACL